MDTILTMSGAGVFGGMSWVLLMCVSLCFTFLDLENVGAFRVQPFVSVFWLLAWCCCFLGLCIWHALCTACLFVAWLSLLPLLASWLVPLAVIF